MKLKGIIKRIFIPARCDICGRIIPFMRQSCEKCGIDTIALSVLACPDCGHEKCICSKGGSIGLPHFTAVYYYQGELKNSLLSFKFSSQSYLYHNFSEAMAKRIREVFPEAEFDAVCFVPSTKKTERIRGYNQSELLAAGIAAELNIPMVSCLEKTRDNYYQKDLTAEERHMNVKDCFRVKRDCAIEGRTLILCDDIKTTGATLRECSEVLLKAGVRDVYCICLAITPYLSASDPF